MRVIATIFGLTFLALALHGTSLPVQAAATILVTTEDDEFSDPGPGDGCSLREAIQSANINVDFGGCSGDGTYGLDDIIEIPAGTYTIAIGGTGEDDNATGDFDIDEDTILRGASEGTTIIDGNEVDRVFHIIGPIVSNTVVFEDMTIRDGLAQNDDGGGILYPDQDEPLVIRRVTLVDNIAEFDGGAIWTGDDAELTDVTIIDNIACGDGGGIYNDGGTLTIVDSLIQENSASVSCLDTNTDGGGIYHTGGGTLTLRGTTVRSNTALGSGGGIYSLFAHVEVLDGSLIELNTALGEEGIFGAGGGGIYIEAGNLTVTDSEISRNTADEPNVIVPIGFGGGGIYGFNAFIDITSSIMQDNEALANSGFIGGEGGGAIYGFTGVIGFAQLDPADCDICISDSWIDGNLADESNGGAFYIAGSTNLSLIRTTVSNNEATSGEIAGGYGGGLYLGGTQIDDSTAYAENVTFSGNVADEYGGAMYLGNGTETELRFVTLSDNQAAWGGAIATVLAAPSETLLTFLATIIGNSTTPGGGAVENCDYDGVTIVTSLGYSIEDQDTCELDDPTDETDTPLLLEELADNGGPAPTHALTLGSPAVDFVAEGCPPPATDERGFERPAEGNDDDIALCDAGAYEFGAEAEAAGLTLVITKQCPNGAGDGDADFQVLVTQLEGAVAADSLDCGEIMVLEDLTEGEYRIRELITGPNANDFLTAIVCSNEDGQTVTPGMLATIDLESDTECDVINVFDDDAAAPADPDAPGAPATPPTIIVPIDIDNENTNALNNNNVNDNNNVNTNTQEQSNQQEQTNDNNQTTTVNSSPSVVIDFDE